jgi:restriction system protein
MENDLLAIIDTFKQCQEIEITDENSDTGKGLFYMEKQLEDFIIHNWEETELGKRYNLIFEEGELKSQQYRTDIGIIDILAKDKIEDNFVVIELKRNQTSDDTVGQITRYMGWIKTNLGDEKVKGVIVAGKYDQKLDYAQPMVEGLEVFLYELNFKLSEHQK